MITIQYSVTAISIGLVALVLSTLMRLQLSFPGLFDQIGLRDKLGRRLGGPPCADDSNAQPVGR